MDLKSLKAPIYIILFHLSSLGEQREAIIKMRKFLLYLNTPSCHLIPVLHHSIYQAENLISVDGCLRYLRAFENSEFTLNFKPN